MFVKLISPRSPVSFVSEREKAVNFSRLSLATVAALFPRDAKIEIINDSIEKIDYNENVDLVGITSITATTPRAYEIADKFRKKGVPVIMGGMHASALPEETIKHVDAVVIGEAEGQIKPLLKDFKNGKLKKFYASEKRPDIKHIPLPRTDLYEKKNKYYKEMHMIQTTRGCPFNCDFCTVTHFFGQTYRTRAVEDIVKEIKTVSRRTLIFFVDDNIAGNPKYAKELFKALIPLNIKWFGQASLVIAKNRELLRLAARSGCISLFMGIESVSQSSLKEVGKSMNKVEDYKESIKIIHDHGIAIIGAFIFGFDSDDKSVFEETVSFIDRNHIELPSLAILTPLPGTRLYDRMEEAGRIISRDWSKYTVGEVVFQPNLLTVEELQEGYYWSRKQLSSFSSIYKRTFHLKKSSLLYIPVNFIMRKASRATLKEAANNNIYTGLF
ncbi:B12-binding domain-containing radical SAM protein [candidate division WOR-3 bacterium]|nr:B12-binding domain-containing radical SAM protein [candidate division WOR-3 bacterium]